MPRKKKVTSAKPAAIVPGTLVQVAFKDGKEGIYCEGMVFPRPISLSIASTSTFKFQRRENGENRASYTSNRTHHKQITRRGTDPKTSYFVARDDGDAGTMSLLCWTICFGLNVSCLGGFLCLLAGC